MSDKNANEPSDQLFLFVAIAILVLVAWSKLHLVMLKFYFKWRILIIAAGAFALTSLYYFLSRRFAKKREPKQIAKAVISKSEDEDSLLAGVSSTGQQVYIKPSQRRMHTQIVGSTNAGKTESVILPWAIDDIRKGRGLIIIDGKSERSLINKLYAYANYYGRTKDVRILSLAETNISQTFNPFYGGSVIEIAERVFAALTFENEYYKNIQYETLMYCLLILEAVEIKATPRKVIELLRSEGQLNYLKNKTDKADLIEWATQFLKLSFAEREQRTSGLIAQLQPFVQGEMGAIFNAENPDIILENAMECGEIIYCQFPAMKIPSLGKAVSKMILQSIQSAVSSRHLGSAASREFFAIYLDDFTEYLTPSFVTLLNKSRSANVGVAFAHQALGDLDALGEGPKNAILTNSNLKIFMRTNEPNSAEYFSSVVGTTLASKVTERQSQGFFGATKTGEGSVRETREFQIHPDVFKQNLGPGDAIVVLPHAQGSLSLRLKFIMRNNLPLIEIPKTEKADVLNLPALPEKSSEAKNSNPKTDKSEAQPSTSQQKSTISGIVEAGSFGLLGSSTSENGSEL